MHVRVCKIYNAYYLHVLAKIFSQELSIHGAVCNPLFTEIMCSNATSANYINNNKTTTDKYMCVANSMVFSRKYIHSLITRKQMQILLIVDVCVDFRQCVSLGRYPKSLDPKLLFAEPYQPKLTHCQICFQNTLACSLLFFDEL